MSEKPYWEGKEFAFFQHKKCEFFPCHNAPEAEEFNCLFCYCPLYALGDKCGGNFVYTEDGIKDCSGCSVPHRRKNYGYIMERYGDLMKLASENREKKD
ncbi:MAG: cysteine-rich small domain-containing protein [Clostridia bacterium]|nr:cysteine-rich small domain-containing protein [Clostridia bacterium]